jgi:2,3-dihydroxybenzoate-AMP ligase
MGIEGFNEYSKEDVEKYITRKWWWGITWGDMFDKATDLYPNKEALVDDTGRFTYAILRENVDRLAIALIKLGIRPKDFVLLQLPNWHEFIYAYFALHKIGAILVLLVPRHAYTEISYLCSLTKPKAWIVPEKYGKIDYLPLIERIRKENPQLKFMISARSGDSNVFIRLEKLLDQAELSPESLKHLATRRPDPMEVGQIMPTGGTTGVPKAAPRTHNDFIANVEYHARAWEITSNDTLLTVAPVSHGQGILVGLGGSFISFAKYVLAESTQPEDICRVIEKEKVTAFPTVPAIINRLVNFDGLRNYELSSLKKIYVGGAPSTPELVRSVYEKIGCKYVNAFGSVEGLSAMTRLDDDIETICNTIGRKDCPYTDLKIIDSNNNELPPNTEGEMVTKGPTIFTGYFNSPEINKDAFTHDGYFRTGDLAKIDEKGNIQITGRIKDIILRGGESISATEIEKLLIAHPDVRDVAVIGMPDKDLGERICAYIQISAGSKVSADKIILFLKNKGASLLQLPERIEFIDAMPLTKVGKVDKKALHEDINRRLG